MTGMAYQSLWLHLEQSSEHMILYALYVDAIFFPCHPTYGVLPYSMILFDAYKYCSTIINANLVRRKVPVGAQNSELHDQSYWSEKQHWETP